MMMFAELRELLRSGAIRRHQLDCESMKCEAIRVSEGAKYFLLLASS